MRPDHPPGIARWLLSRFGCSPNNASIIGDLDEQYRAGRPAGWYNRQAFLAFVRGWHDAIREHPFLTVSALALSAVHLVALTAVFVNLAHGAINPLTDYAFAKVLPSGWWAYNAVFWPVDLILMWMPLFLISVATGLIIAWVYGVHARAMLLTCLAFTCVFVVPVVFNMIVRWAAEPTYFSVRGIFIPPLTLLGLALGGRVFHAPRELTQSQ